MVTNTMIGCVVYYIEMNNTERTIKWKISHNP